MVRYRGKMLWVSGDILTQLYDGITPESVNFSELLRERLGLPDPSHLVPGPELNQASERVPKIDIRDMAVGESRIFEHYKNSSGQINNSYAMRCIKKYGIETKKEFQTKWTPAGILVTRTL